MKKEEFEEQILKRLGILISLQLDSGRDEAQSSTASKVKRLASLGLPPSEIGSIIRKPTNYVSAVLTSRKTPKSGTARRTSRE